MTGTFGKTVVEACDALVIGGGPAGLMAAEALGTAGRRVIVAEAMPTMGRKLLMAGKSGLNLTKAEEAGAFLAAYAEAAPVLRPMLDAFGPEEVAIWAEGLGQPVFTGSSGRVFPEAMKASPLLRAWLARLAGFGAEFRTRWRWLGFDGAACRFDTPQGERSLAPAVTVLALGGASWRRLGSDGAWAGALAAEGCRVAPFAPANAGLSIDWSGKMAPVFGRPLKAVALTAGRWSSRGECVISARGLEGSGVYAISRGVREGAELVIDLLPHRDEAWIAARLARAGKASIGNRLRKALGLDVAKVALALECARPLPSSEALPGALKALRLPPARLRPLDEAISTAGGLDFAELDAGLMLRRRPGTFAAGEMLNWEAPTGGYLLTACLATGLWAGRQAAASAGSDSGGVGVPKEGGGSAKIV